MQSKIVIALAKFKIALQKLLHFNITIHTVKKSGQPVPFLVKEEYITWVKTKKIKFSTATYTSKVAKDSFG